MNKIFQNAKRGFTLVELLIVIIIIAVLAGVVLIALNPAEQRSRAVLTTVKSNVAAVCRAQALCMVENDAASCTDADLTDGLIDPFAMPVPNDGGAYSIGAADPYTVTATNTQNTVLFTFTCDNTSGTKGQVICVDNAPATETTYTCANFNL